jgi:NADH-quinone oxidoreductase subunit K
VTATVWVVSLVLFAAGLAMVVLRRQLLAMLLGLELMISAANIALVYHSGLFRDADGLSAALLIIAVAAGEAVVGLSLILRLQEAGRAPDAGVLTELRG